MKYRATAFQYTRTQCCGSGMFIPDPGKKFVIIPYFVCSHKFHKIEYYFIFEILKTKIWANLQRIIEVFTQTFFTKLF